MADLAPARRDVIVARLTEGQQVQSAVLAAEFGVSEDAIRRDLRILASEGRCRRVYGGALPLRSGAVPMAARIGENAERKRALAVAAVQNVQDRELIFIDSGSTNLALVDMLPELPDLTVATNSIDIAATVLRRSDLRLLLIGGIVDTLVGGSTDATATLAVSNMNIDRCFLGACSVSDRGGLSAFDPGDAAFKRALLAASRRSIVLALNEKLGTQAPFRVGALDAAEAIVIEEEADPDAVADLEAAGATLVRAGVRP